MSDEKLAERATAYIAQQRAQFTDGFSAIHTAHRRLQAALDVAIKERAEARAEVERLRAEIERTHALLKDPNAVAVNMLRGVIALPSADQIRHIYQQTLEAHP